MGEVCTLVLFIAIAEQKSAFQRLTERRHNFHPGDPLFIRVVHVQRWVYGPERQNATVIDWIYSMDLVQLNTLAPNKSLAGRKCAQVFRCRYSAYVKTNTCGS